MLSEAKHLFTTTGCAAQLDRFFAFAQNDRDDGLILF